MTTFLLHSGKQRSAYDIDESLMDVPQVSSEANVVHIWYTGISVVTQEASQNQSLITGAARKTCPIVSIPVLAEILEAP